MTRIIQDEVLWHQIAIERAENYKELKNLSDFVFNFEVTDRSRAFGEVRTLIESTGLKMKFASQQIWHIIILTKLIKVTISELDQLYVGSEKGRLTTNGVNQIIESQNHALCCSGMKKLSQSLMKYQMI